MNKLIKGNLIMTNIADKDIEMYIKSGWKLVNKHNQVTSEKQNKEVKDVKNTTPSDFIEK